jgi:DNA ligase 1
MTRKRDQSSQYNTESSLVSDVASFYDFALVCQSLGQTSSRLQIAQLAGDFLARLGVDEAAIAARFMVGRGLPNDEEKRLQVSGRAIWRVVAELVPGDEDRGEDIFATAVDFGEAIEILLRLRATEPDPTLTLAEVGQRLVEIASIEGPHSRRRKFEVLRGLFARANALEGKYLAKIVIREMRHGMSEGLMLDAIARMAGCPVGEIRRAHMLDPDLGRVVRQFHPRGTGTEPDDAKIEAPSSIRAEASQCVSTAIASPSGASSGTQLPFVLKPILPMLAAPAASVTAAFEILGASLALESKLDGARVQIHCTPSGVHVFSRRMNDISSSLPEVIELMAPLCERRAIFDGEVIAVGERGEALAFQELMRRFGRVRGIERVRAEQPIRLFIFDLIGVDGNLLIDTTYQQRYDHLAELTGQAGLELARRIVPGSAAEGQEFYARAIAAGYEGVMAKGLSSLYTPGARGRGWLKIKHARTLDLVIVAADWGYGRRHGWLSNYHLAVRDAASGQFMEVGKTFKGLTDADFEEMTRRLQALKIEERGGTVFVRPEIVVEVAYSDIQRSPRYAVGMALRFARILHFRGDKSAQEADTIETLAAEFDRQLVKPLNPRQ